jgi:hypothetical protein
VLFGDGFSIDEFRTDSSTSFGHANAAGAESVGAAYFLETPEYGMSPPILQPYSSAGGTPILFDTSGVPLVAPEVRLKPEIIAVDGVNTTFFYEDEDGDLIPDFPGTSAAAAHAAGVAALMLEAKPGATPFEINTVLESTAIDMGTTGFDHDSGYGLIQTDLAIAALIVDTDGDGVSDVADNCMLIPNGPNDTATAGPSQNDTDMDNYGNRCDADFNNNGLVDAQDFLIMRLNIGSSTAPDQDLNGNGTVDAQDFLLIRLGIGQPPGPSGLAP